MLQRLDVQTSSHYQSMLNGSRSVSQKRAFLQQILEASQNLISDPFYGAFVFHNSSRNLCVTIKSIQ